MGGIKNKLTKKLSKFLPLDRRNASGISSRISIGGFDRLVKHTGIACLSLAILSTLVLNIISSYSYGKINSKAEPVAQSANGTLVSGPASISLSLTPIITPTSSQCDTSNSSICMSIPDGGGIATGGHTVEVNNTSITGKADLALTSSNADWALESDNNSDFTIQPISLDPVLGDPSAYLTNATWGMALFTPNNPDMNSSLTDILGDERNFIDSNYNETRWLPPSVVEAGESFENGTLSSINFYYGVYMDSPSVTPAGNYSIGLIYTATAMLPESPTIDGITPSGYELDSSADSAATITGTNLASTYKVYLESDADTNINYDLTNSITNVTDDEIKVALPTDTTNPELEAGDYTIHVITQGGEESTGFTYTEKKALSIYDSVDNVRVDYDENMIPVKYVGYDGNGGGHWAVVTDTEVEQNTSNWFRYNTTERRWANAITVTAEAREAYRKKQTGEDPDPAILSNNNPTGNGEANPEILGYWVYIPRYAYEVQRRDAVDASVDPQNFDIVFQTADEKNSPAATCSTISSHKDYRTECGIPTTYTANSDNTTWTTHPAFTFGNTELNGIWVGKFETTGTRVNPTVKPNQHANISEPVGNFYTTAKHIGIYDKYNIGGNNVTGKNLDGNDVTLVAHTSTEWNSLHNLANATSHMLKNSEWGALTYLAHSDYGAGINSERTRATNVNKNGATATSSTDADGDVDTDGASAATGCGPASTGSDNSYTVSTQLNITTIESPGACGSADKAYNSSDGVLASTTNNIYGAYDTSGGVYEYVAGTRTSKQNSSESTNVMENEVTYPFVDLYRTVDSFGRRPSWASGGNSTESGYNFIVCTYELCGGTSTYETNISDNVPGIQNSWGFVASQFVWLDQQWFRRGGSASNDKVNPFYINPQNGQGYYYNGFRAVLILATDH